MAGTGLPKHFNFHVSEPKHTALKLVALTDSRTSFTVRTALANDGLQVPAIMAFAGARFSRSGLTAEELFAEINTNAVSAQKKLANIFNNYGHASVGDMAMLFAYIENVPRYLMFQFFYSTALGGGQERSSRYQNFAQSTPPDFSLFTENRQEALSARYRELYNSLIDAYKHYLPLIEESFTKIFAPETGNKSQASALKARVFDTVRAFLPAGASTSGAYITSAREWARLVTVFKASEFHDARCLGEQLEVLFSPPEEVAEQIGYSPEAPDLIRHTEADVRLNQMLEELKPFAADLATTIAGPGKKAALRAQKVRHLPDLLEPAQAYLFFSLVTIYPMLTIGKFKIWYNSLTDYTKRRLSTLIFSRYTHHNHLPQYARTGGYTFELKASLSEMIDFNRHRAWGRYTPFLETGDVVSLIKDGYTLPLYLDHPKLKKLKTAFSDILKRHYDALLKFGLSLPEDVSSRSILALLPNAHLLRYYMTGGPKELSYLPQLRVRPGGHINYRALAYEMAKQAAAIDPLLSGLSLPKDKKPDPFSREEFFDRS